MFHYHYGYQMSAINSGVSHQSSPNFYAM